MHSSWIKYRKDYQSYLKIEKSLSPNSIEAYIRDFDKLTQYLEHIDSNKSALEIQLSDLQNFISWIHNMGIAARSQARVICIRNFFFFLILEDDIQQDPSELLELRKLEKSYLKF